MVDSHTIGRRVADARSRAELTQSQLAGAVGLDRSALAKIESGQRQVSAVELARFSEVLDTRIEWFVDDAPPAILSRRNTQRPGEPDPQVDTVAEHVAREVEFVVTYDERLRLTTVPTQELPRTFAEADALAASARDEMSVERSGPCTDLGTAVANCGLLVFVFDLGTEAADAATILLSDGAVAVVNGRLQVGRRRLALAHELAHYLIADEYSVDWRIAEYAESDRREGLLDRFARALLLPADSLRTDWEHYLSSADGDIRGAAVRTASVYRVDMATLAQRLRELDILDEDDAARVRSVRTTRADIVELDLVVPHELEAPSLPREYQRAVLRLFRAEVISADRATGLLFGTWSRDMLPELPPRDPNQIWEYV